MKVNSVEFKNHTFLNDMAKRFYLENFSNSIVGGYWDYEMMFEDDLSVEVKLIAGMNDEDGKEEIYSEEEYAKNMDGLLVEGNDEP